MRLCGDSDRSIADALAIDPGTLRKYHSDDLANGHAQRRRIVVGSLFAAARNGSFAAMAKLEKMGRCPPTEDMHV